MSLVGDILQLGRIINVGKHLGKGDIIKHTVKKKGIKIVAGQVSKGVDNCFSAISTKRERCSIY